MSELPSKAAAVIIGGGVMGTSIAFHLAEAGAEGIVLLEQNELGSGSTCKAAGGVRAQFSDPVNIQLAQRSLEAFARFPERPGQEIDFRRAGYLFLLSRDEDVRAFEQSIALQREYGVPSRLIEPKEAKRLSPLIETDGLLAAAFSPDDGLATPEAVVYGYARGARQRGVHIATQCRVTNIETRGGSIRHVDTSLGSIETGTVICTAGAWSREVGDMVGVDLPVTPYRRQVLFTEPMASLPPMPMTIDFATSFYFHAEGRGLLVGMSYQEEPPGFHLDRNDAWVPSLLAAAERRAPAVGSAGIASGWAGLYEITPDHNAIVGEAPSLSRFLYATGFSGHGFLQGPAIGETIRDLYLGREPAVDVSGLSAARFTAGATRPERNIV
ncbi:NAD(P)/FAD-dependent oxidoreductase [Pendulispora albinea]|uniref:FAD-binding oxidoreductase n=1 Tax=Pendulispora albinea TaxID=2741071 RepID=A0ABZ2M3B7_9BACT